MAISIKQDNETIAVELEEDDWDKTPLCEDEMLVAIDALRRVFPIESVTRAYYRIDPECLGLRDKDDPVGRLYSSKESGNSGSFHKSLSKSPFALMACKSRDKSS